MTDKETSRIRLGDDYQASIPAIEERGPELNIGESYSVYYSHEEETQKFMNLLKRIYMLKENYQDKTKALKILQQANYNIEKALYIYFHPLAPENSISAELYISFYEKVTKEVELKQALERIQLQIDINADLKSSESLTFSQLTERIASLTKAKISDSKLNLLNEISVSVKKWQDFLELNLKSPQSIKKLESMKFDTQQRFPFLKSKEITLINRTLSKTKDCLKLANSLIAKINSIPAFSDNITEINSLVKEGTSILNQSKTLQSKVTDSEFTNTINTISSYILLFKVYYKKEKGIFSSILPSLRENKEIFLHFEDTIKMKFIEDFEKSQNLNNNVEKLLKQQKLTEAKELSLTSKKLSFHNLNLEALEEKVKKSLFISRIYEIIEKTKLKSLPEEELWSLEKDCLKYLKTEHKLFNIMENYIADLLKLKYKLSSLLNLPFPEKEVRKINYFKVPLLKPLMSLQESKDLISSISNQKFIPVLYLEKIKEIHETSKTKTKAILNFMQNNESLSFAQINDINSVNTNFINIYALNNSFNKILENFKDSFSKCLKLKSKLEDILNTNPTREKDIKHVLVILANDSFLKKVELDVKQKALTVLETSKKLKNYFLKIFQIEGKIDFYEFSENFTEAKRFKSLKRIENYEKISELVEVGEKWLNIVQEKLKAFKGEKTTASKTNLDVYTLKNLITSKPANLSKMKFGKLENTIEEFVDNFEILKKAILEINHLTHPQIKAQTQKQISDSIINLFNLVKPILSFNPEISFNEEDLTTSFSALKILYKLFNLTERENYLNSYLSLFLELLPFIHTKIFAVFSISSLYKKIVENVSVCLKWVSKVNYRMYEYYSEATFFILGIDYHFTSHKKLSGLLNIESKRLEELDSNEDENKIEVHCYCRIPHDEVLDMIMCDSCLRWYHLNCALLGNEDVENDTNSFCCLECCVETNTKYIFLERVIWTSKDVRPSKFGILKNKPSSELIKNFITDFNNLKLENIKMYEVHRLEEILLSASDWSENSNKYIKQLKATNEQSKVDRFLLQRAFNHICKGAAQYIKVTNIKELMNYLLTSICILNLESFQKTSKYRNLDDINWKGIFGISYSKHKVKFSDLEILYKKMHKFKIIEVAKSVQLSPSKKDVVEKTLCIRKCPEFTRKFMEFYSRAMSIDENIQHCFNEETKLDEAENFANEATSFKCVYFEELKRLKGMINRIKKISANVTDQLQARSMTYSKLINYLNDLNSEFGKITSPVKYLLSKEKKKSDDWTTRFRNAISAKNMKLADLEKLWRELQAVNKPYVDTKDRDTLRKHISNIRSGTVIMEEYKKRAKVTKSNFKFFIEDSCFLTGVIKIIIEILKKNDIPYKQVLYVKNYLNGIIFRNANVKEAESFADLAFAKTIAIIKMASDFDELKNKLSPLLKDLMNKKLMKVEDCKRLLTSKNQTEQLLMNCFIRLEKLCPKHKKK